MAWTRDSRSGMSIDLEALVISLFPSLLQEAPLANLFSILLVVEDDIEEGAVYVDATIVVQEAQLPELIHEETHP